MKIAFFVTDFPTLSETFVLQQVVFLIKSGHEVEVFARSPGRQKEKMTAFMELNLQEKVFYVLPDGSGSFLGRLVEFISSFTVICLRRPIFFWNFVKNFFSFKKSPIARFQAIGIARLFLNHGPYDIIHCHFGQNGMVAAFLQDLGIISQPFITTFHGSDITVLTKKHGTQVYKRLFQCGSIFTVNSSFLHDKLVYAGCDKLKTRKLPVGVDLSKLPFSAKRLAPDGTLHILSVCNLVEVKGVEYSIRAIAKVSQKYPLLLFTIIGEGPLLENLKEITEQLDLSGKVKFLGGILHEHVLLHHYRTAHIYLYSGIRAEDGSQEAQGLALLEAQAAGLPVIATLVGGVPDSVVDGRSGILVAEKDIDALSDKIQFLIEHSELWPEMGKKGRAHVEAQFDKKKLNKQLLGIYAEVSGHST